MTTAQKQVPPGKKRPRTIRLERSYALLCECGGTDFDLRVASTSEASRVAAAITLHCPACDTVCITEILRNEQGRWYFTPLLSVPPPAPEAT